MTTSVMTEVFVAIGSNLADPLGQARCAVAALAALDNKDCQNLNDAFDLLAQLRWEKHQHDLQQGHDVTNMLDPMEISGLARHQLKDGFAVINEAQSRLKHRFCRDM